jgi:hypothetical protein
MVSELRAEATQSITAAAACDTAGCSPHGGQEAEAGRTHPSLPSFHRSQ